MIFFSLEITILEYFPGIPDQLREVAKNSKPALEVSNSGNSWTLKTTVSDRVKDTTFNVGEEFESKSLTGDTMKVSCQQSFLLLHFRGHHELTYQRTMCTKEGFWPPLKPKF